MIKNEHNETTQTITILKPEVGGKAEREILKLIVDKHYMNILQVSFMVDEFIREFNQRYATRL